MSPGKVVVEDPSSLGAWAKIEPVLMEYANSLGVDIHVSYPKEVYPPQSGRGKLFIRFYSFPPGRSLGPKNLFLDTAYGVYLEHLQGWAFPPTDATPFVIVDSEEASVAQVAGDTLYVLFNLPNTETRTAGALTRFIMEDYVKKFHGMSPEEKKSRTAEMQKRQFKPRSARSSFAKLFLSARQNRQPVKEEIADLYDKLSKIAKSNGSTLRVSEDEIRLGIGQIDIEREGRVYDIGDFELSIFPNGDEGSEYVRCINLTCPVGGYFHPTVGGDGTCCLGNIKEAVEKMAKEGQWVHLVYTMTTFLKRGIERLEDEDEEWYVAPYEWPLKITEEQNHE